jgi:hypothetical protein
MSEDTRRVNEEWWTDDQRELVEDLSRYWTKTRFETGPGIWISMNGGRMLRKLRKGEDLPEGCAMDMKAWDHEHCALCWRTISENPVHQQEGYTDGEDWLCIECYNKYIMPPENR